ncbi:MAG TPA: hypothetical protein VHK64_02085, partial [Nocardioidaceae bacterium]|nr:hypothetical protein [Nocardioidaceae bacterium]
MGTGQVVDRRRGAIASRQEPVGRRGFAVIGSVSSVARGAAPVPPGTRAIGDRPLVDGRRDLVARIR